MNLKYTIIILLYLTASQLAWARIDTTIVHLADINKIILEIDTLTADRNYHVLLSNITEDSYRIEIWINNRLGGIMFEQSGMNICQFYKLNNSNVYLYEVRPCNCLIPDNFINQKYISDYEYLDKSPFYNLDGFHKSILVEDFGGKLKWTELIEKEDKELQELLKSIRTDY